MKPIAVHFGYTAHYSEEELRAFAAYHKIKLKQRRQLAQTLRSELEANGWSGVAEQISAGRASLGETFD